MWWFKEKQFYSPFPWEKRSEIINYHQGLLCLGSCKLSPESSPVSQGRGVCFTSHSHHIQPVLCHGRAELLLTKENAQKESGQVKERVEKVCFIMFQKKNEITYPQGAQRNRIIIQDNSCSWLCTIQ